MTRTNAEHTVVRAVIVIVGVFYVLTGLALLFASEWFFTNVGYFPPFNRHYAGDVGTFLLPIGVGLLIAARDPIRHRLLVGVAAVGSLLHVFNHLYDDLAAGDPGHLLTDITPLLILALLMLAAFYRLTRETR